MVSPSYVLQSDFQSFQDQVLLQFQTLSKKADQAAKLQLQQTRADQLRHIRTELDFRAEEEADRYSKLILRLNEMEKMQHVHEDVIRRKWKTQTPRQTQPQWAAEPDFRAEEEADRHSKLILRLNEMEKMQHVHEDVIRRKLKTQTPKQPQPRWANLAETNAFRLEQLHQHFGEHEEKLKGVLEMQTAIHAQFQDYARTLGATLTQLRDKVNEQLEYETSRVVAKNLQTQHHDRVFRRLDQLVAGVKSQVEAQARESNAEWMDTFTSARQETARELFEIQCTLREHVVRWESQLEAHRGTDNHRQVLIERLQSEVKYVRKYCETCINRLVESRARHESMVYPYPLGKLGDQIESLFRKESTEVDDRT